jgi:hypothetical protein
VQRGANPDEPNAWWAKSSTGTKFRKDGEIRASRNAVHFVVTQTSVCALACTDLKAGGRLKPAPLAKVNCIGASLHFARNADNGRYSPGRVAR